jgi:sigma-54 dependent transcriptional regulator, acetoin dehydrogenase operon transcriptional activator AcoR
LLDRPRAEQRLHQIARARRAVLHDGLSLPGASSEAWIEHSWRRCLARGQEPDAEPHFDQLSSADQRRTDEANRILVEAARPVMARLGQAIADTRYFAILTNADGVVVDVNGPIDRHDRRAELIARIGVDLSEARVGTTAIGAALAELAPVWLHQGEHFFDANSHYSCAGAPLFGPDGRCVGMLDLTGIDAIERPELKHMAIQSARSIENALIPVAPAGLLIRLNWSAQSLGCDTDGLIGFDQNGLVTGANAAARQMVPALTRLSDAPTHCSELFALSPGLLFDAARQRELGFARGIEVPLWSGLRLYAMPGLQGAQRVSAKPGTSPAEANGAGSAASPVPLKEVETALIRRAVTEAKGNVMKAARLLGVSRATVYRRLGRSNKPD